MSTQEFLIILVCMLASAFFSGVEIAYVSANRLYFELQAKQGTLAGRLVADFLKKPSRFIGTMLIGNTLALVLYGLYMENFLHHEIAPWLNRLPAPFQFLNNGVVQILLPSFLATLLILAVAEFTPKSLFLINPDVFLETLSLPVWLVYWLLSPLVITIVSGSKWFIKNVLRLRYSESKAIFGMTDLTHYLQNLNVPEGRKEEPGEVDTKIFNNALEFRQLRVRDCMIPRTEIVAIEIEEGPRALRRAFQESGHSKVLIYRDSLEDVLGYCHALSLFRKPKDIESILNPIMIVPEVMSAQDLMVRLTKEGRSIALVVDEFGGTSGLVSLEDVIEQIFGDIQDEYDDAEDWVERRLDDDSFLLSARHEIDYLNETYGWNLPEGDYDTLGGLIITLNEDLPVAGEVVELPPYTFEVVSTTEARIDLVKLTVGEALDDRRSR